MKYPILALILANIIWGAAPPIFKLALQNIPPYTLAFLRFFSASVIFMVFAFKHWQRLSGKDMLTICVAAFFGISIKISFYYMGLLTGQSINAPIIASSEPVFLFLIAIFFLHEKFHKKVFIGMIMALIGVLIIILSPILIDGDKQILSQTGANIFFLIATWGAIINVIISKKLLNRINTYQFAFISFVFAALTFLPFSIIELSHWSFSMLDIRGIVGIIFGVFFSSAAAYFLFYWSISKMKTQEIGLFTYIDPIVALLIAIPLLGEYPTIYYFLGAILVFVGIYIAEHRLHMHPIHELKHRKPELRS